MVAARVVNKGGRSGFYTHLGLPLFIDTDLVARWSLCAAQRAVRTQSQEPSDAGVNISRSD
jgi:hypothetical protein